MENLDRPADEIASARTLVMDPAEFAALAQAAIASNVLSGQAKHLAAPSLIARLRKAFRSPAD